MSSFFLNLMRRLRARLRTDENPDQVTATAFATSWNSLAGGSIYTYEQFKDWMEPLSESDVRGRTVLELGCGNGSIMEHLLRWKPEHLQGVDLGESVQSARANLRKTPYSNWNVQRANLISYQSDKFDLVYCIGVLHHLRDPDAGFQSVIANSRSGGRFHCWVYAREGNRLVITLVEPIRKFASKLPWRVNKYLVSFPLALLFFFYAKMLSGLRRWKVASRLPMSAYCEWIAQRGVMFFHHVVFDQLVTPRTTYLERNRIEEWLQDDQIEKGSTYIVMRNGNSWKFGGRVL